MAAWADLGENTLSDSYVLIMSRLSVLWTLARTIEGEVVGRHGLSADFEGTLSGSQRATAEQALIVALVRLEGLLVGAESA